MALSNKRPPKGVYLEKYGIPLLYYYINLKSSIICCLSCEDIYLSYGGSLLASFDDNYFECNSLGDLLEIIFSKR